jgi:hypothetical protein
MYLEANINEFYRRALDDEETVTHNDDPDSIFTESFYQNLHADNTDFSRYDLRSQYRKFLDYAGEDRFDEDEEPWDSFDLLIEWRNHFVHFESEYHDATPDPNPHGLVNRLAEKHVSSNPWLPADKMTYPHQAFGPGLTSWAVHAAVNLTDDFHSRVGSDRRYDRICPW